LTAAVARRGYAAVQFDKTRNSFITECGRAAIRVSDTHLAAQKPRHFAGFVLIE
jgi:hypothetical protein